MIRLQGGYYLLGGLWRLVHRRSFEAVSGPKPDQFQTDVAAALFVATGAALLAAPTRVLAAATGASVACVDLKHRRTIRSIFLVEAALELGFVAAALRRLDNGRPTRLSRPRNG